MSATLFFSKGVFCLLLLLSGGCSTPRALQHHQSAAEDSLLTRQSSTQENSRIDAEHRGDYERIEVEFFASQQFRLFADTLLSPASALSLTRPVAAPAVKRVALTRYRTAERLHQENELQQSDTLSQIHSVQSVVTDQSAPAPDPYRWRYLFYTTLLAFAVFVLFWFRRS